jgi:hypothetical protein
MSSADEVQLAGAARHLTAGGLIAIAWAGVGVACFFVVARCVARFSEIKRLHVDDYWMITALLVLAVNAVLQTLQAPSLYYLVDVEAGRVPAGEPLLVQGNIYVRYEFTIIALFWTVLWCVKASFLSLFHRLFDGLPKYRLWWWGVVVFAALAYVGCWIASAYTCHPPSTYFQFGKFEYPHLVVSHDKQTNLPGHCEKPIDVKGGNISISYSTAVDILSDMMIMVLPLRLLHKLQVSTRQKMGLVGVFTVGIAVVVTAIVRLTQIIGQERSDPVGLAVWGLVESSISVIVGSLPPLKNVLGRQLNRTRQGYSPYGADHSYGLNSKGKMSLKGRSRVTSIPLEETANNMTSKHSHTHSKGEIQVQQQDLTWIKSDSEGDAESGRHEAYDDEARIIGLGK